MDGTSPTSQKSSVIALSLANFSLVSGKTASESLKERQLRTIIRRSSRRSCSSKLNTEKTSANSKLRRPEGTCICELIFRPRQLRVLRSKGDLRKQGAWP